MAQKWFKSMGGAFLTVVLVPPPKMELTSRRTVSSPTKGQYPFLGKFLSENGPILVTGLIFSNLKTYGPRMAQMWFKSATPESSEKIFFTKSCYLGIEA